MQTGGAFSIVVDAGPAIAMLAQASVGIDSMLLKQLAELSEVIKEEMRDHAPIGIGGEDGLKGSIGFAIRPATMSSEIMPSMDYADDVETGTGPHWVSAKSGSPLAQWAEMKGISPYAIQNVIAKRGTMPHPFIKPTYDAVQDVISDRFAAAVAAYIEELDHGL